MVQRTVTSFRKDSGRTVLTLDQREQLANAARRLTPEEVADTYEALIDRARGNRLTVYSPGRAGTVPQDGTPVSSIEAFNTSSSR